MCADTPHVFSADGNVHWRHGKVNEASSTCRAARSTQKQRGRNIPVDASPALSRRETGRAALSRLAARRPCVDVYA